MKEIKLTQDKIAIIDEDDFEKVSLIKWYASFEGRGTKWYAKRTCTKSEKEFWRTKSIRMHYFILNIRPMDLPEGHVIDHINHDGLDNRKCNLEIVTQEENMRRSEGWKKPREEPCL